MEGILFHEKVKACKTVKEKFKEWDKEVFGDVKQKKRVPFT